MSQHATQPPLPPVDPMALNAITDGVWASKAMTGAQELGLFTLLGDGRTASTKEIAKELSLPERAMDLLLTACAALGLLDGTSNGYQLSEIAATYLVPGKPYYFGDWPLYLSRYNYAAWLRITDAVRSDGPTAYDSEEQDHLFDLAEDREQLRIFWEGLYAFSRYTAASFANTVDLSPTRRLLDVGGGGGVYSITITRLNPEIRADIYDLPHVCEFAKEKIAEAEMDSHVGTIEGDFLTDETLPSGYDTVLISTVLHDWPPETVADILRKIYDALPSGGRIIINELLVNDEKNGPLNPALMNLAMLIVTTGRNYIRGEYVQFLTDAGFTDITVVPYPGGPSADGAVIGVKP